MFLPFVIVHAQTLFMIAHDCGFRSVFCRFCPLEPIPIVSLPAEADAPKDPSFLSFSPDPRGIFSSSANKDCVSAGPLSPLGSPLSRSRIFRIRRLCLLARDSVRGVRGASTLSLQ